MPLHRFRRQYEQLSQSERGRIIGGVGTSGSERCHLHEDLDRPVAKKDHQIVRKARIQPTVSSATIQAQVAPSLGVPVSSRTMRKRLAEGHLGSWRPLRVLPLTHTHRRLLLEWFHARKLDCSGMEPGNL
ncbi:transposable element Tcb2 transposase [Trichonephila clavipes]|nr:transposable element Tcb2 transposase [Trichonephila clavipes]